MSVETTDAVNHPQGEPAQVAPESAPADRTEGEPKRVDEREESGLIPDADRIAMVSIDANGKPAQTVNFHVLLPEDATDEHKAAALNEAGRKLGAEHVTDEDHAKADKAVGLKSD